MGRSRSRAAHGVVRATLFPGKTLDRKDRLTGAEQKTWRAKDDIVATVGTTEPIRAGRPRQVDLQTVVGRPCTLDHYRVNRPHRGPLPPLSGLTLRIEPTSV